MSKVMSEMRRLVAVAAMVLGVALFGVARASTYTYQPTPPDLYDLEHQKAYRWGINLGISASEEVNSASIRFNSIYDWTNETNSLYIQLMPSATSGVTVYTDNEATSNYFNGTGILLKQYQNLPTYAQTLTYTFTSSQIDTLKSYAADNNIGLGIDPDCHFYNSGITLTLGTQPKQQSTPASLGDYVWEDKNANGVQDAGEPGISGVTVNLLDASGNPTGGTTSTNASGYYLFDNLTSGDYGVQFTRPAAYDKFSPKDVGTNDAIDSDADSVTGKTAITNLASAEVDLTWDAGLFKYAALGDYVWFDANLNGIQDTDEIGIDDVIVKLLDAGQNVITTQQTAGGGRYLFTQLTPGSYYIQFVAPQGLLFTLPNVGTNDAIDSDANAATGLTSLITLQSGDYDATWDAGLYQVKGTAPEPSGLMLLGLCTLGLAARRVRK